MTNQEIVLQIFADTAARIAQALDERDQVNAALQAVIRDQMAEIEALKAAQTPPEPPIVVPPTPTGQFTLSAQNMITGADGWFRSMNLGADQKCYLQARFSRPILPGETVRFSYKVRTNVIFDGTKNLKDFRSWGGDTYPNDYTGRSLRTGAHQIAAENGDGKVLYQKANPDGWNVSYYSMPSTPDQEMEIIREIRFSSKKDAPDGMAKITVNGKMVFYGDNWICNGPRQNFLAQMVYAPNQGDSGKLPPGAYFEAKVTGLELL